MAESPPLTVCRTVSDFTSGVKNGICGIMHHITYVPEQATDHSAVYRALGDVYSQGLYIDLKRTVRVSDNDVSSDLPPDLGSFPLYSVKKYKNKLPDALAAKGGYFLPVHQREAMWIKFESESPFAIKIYVGGINAVSGEPAHETEHTMLRRLSLMTGGGNIQDYIVTPDQCWVDGIASTNGQVRQFVAMPLGTGYYSVETQITGEDAIGGIQIEVTPSKIPEWVKNDPRLCIREKPASTPTVQIYVKEPTRKLITLDVTTLHTLYEVQDMIFHQESIPPAHQRLTANSETLMKHRTLGDYGTGASQKLHLNLRLSGGA